MMNPPCRTYVFNKLLPQPSELLTVTLPRPLGVVFEFDTRLKRAMVVDVVEGSAAAQRQKVAGLNPRLAKETVQPGRARSSLSQADRLAVACKHPHDAITQMCLSSNMCLYRHVILVAGG